MDWYPWFIDDFRRDTLHLSLAEDGAYRRLIDEYMKLRGPLPDDDRALARILGVDTSEWLSVAPRVRKFFKAKDGSLHHKRCDGELRAQNARAKRYSERGKKAAFAKYSKPKGLTPRRKLVPPTIQYIDKLPYVEHCTEEGATEEEPSPKGRASFGNVTPLSSLGQIVKAKGWA